MKRAVVALLIIAAIGAGAGAYYMRRGGVEIKVLTAPITRGDVIDTIGATGTLQAVNTVQVGSQVSGNIQYLGADFNSIVKKGQVIARLDPSLFDAQLQQARANLAQAQANLLKAQSDLERSKVQLLDAQQKYARAKELAAKSLLPQSDLDAAKVAVDSAQATLASQDATVTQSQAAVSQSRASLNQSHVNRNHTVIEAPIDGIVTQRSVDVGQTVAASMQAPTLFVIAADLTKMQVNASIDEADVGRIRPGQRVTFRVDAYPTETFEGTVAQIRLQPVVVQNVTTYGTVINVPNPQLKLKPGMTATVRVEVAHKTSVLRVPNAAIRFRPGAEVFAALNQPPPEAQFGGGRDTGPDGQGHGGGNLQTPPSVSVTNPPAAIALTYNAPRADAPAARPGVPAASAQQGGGRGSFGRDGNGGGGQSDRRAQMLERFKTMPPDQQQQVIDRMKQRGQDVSALQTVSAPRPSEPLKSKYGADQPAQTIDALFAPLPAVETRGRVWLFTNNQLKPVNVRLGITDATNTELVSGELQENMVMVMAGNFASGGVRQGQGAASTLTPDDAAAIAGLPGVQYSAAGSNIRSQVVAGNQNWPTQIQGTDVDTPLIRSWQTTEGGFFTPQDVSTASKVAVLGATVRDQLFGPGVNPVGEVIRISNQSFTVAGVMGVKGQTGVGQDQDDVVFVPYTTVMKKLRGITFIQQVQVSAASAGQTSEVADLIATTLRARHQIQPGDPDDFMVRTMDEIASVRKEATQTMTALLAGIAGVSLLVGGIGIMNIMLVSVTERTREIGLRMAIGARGRDVLLQFLVEAMVLSLVGGSIGIALGFGLSKGLTFWLQWPTHVSPDAVAIAFGFAAATGVFFGFYPARKAAALDPIEALRFE